MALLKKIATFPFKSKKRAFVFLLCLCLVGVQYYLFAEGIVKPLCFTLKITPRNSIINQNEETKIKVFGVFPFYAKNSVEYSSSNQNIVRITNEGKAVGVSEGVAVITAKIGNKTATTQIDVRSISVIYFAKGKYLGEAINGKRNGYGTMYYENGNVYEGFWKDDVINGFGVMLWKSQNKYVGEWKNEQFDGFGQLEYKNEYKYSGGWQNGSFNGYGVIEWENGDSYSGEWVIGQMNGYGVFSWNSKDEYKGFWKNGSRDGFGEFIFNRNRSKYVGFWTNNLREGYGIEYNNNRIYYMGQWKNNLYNGYGRLYRDSENIEFQGEFKENNPVFR